MICAKNIFHGWKIVIVCTIVNTLLGAGYLGFGSLLLRISEDQGWERADVSMAMVPAAVFLSLLLPVAGAIVDRVGPRKPMLAGCAIASAGTLLACLAFQPWHLYVFFGLIGLGSVLATSVATFVLIAHWFQRRRGLAWGTVVALSAVGSLIIPSIIHFLESSLGWRLTFVVIGILAGLTVPLVFFIVRNRPSDMGIYPDGIPAESLSMSIPGHTLGQALGTGSFWLIVLATSLVGAAGVGAGVHSIYYLIDVLGHSSLSAATNHTISSVLAIPGIVVFGFLADRWGLKRTYNLSAVLMAIGIAILIPASSWWFLVPHAIFFGFSLHGAGLITDLAIPRSHGLSNLGLIYAVISMVASVGSWTGNLPGFWTHPNPLAYRLFFFFLSLAVLLSAYCIYKTKPLAQVSPQATKPD